MQEENGHTQEEEKSTHSAPAILQDISNREEVCRLNLIENLLSGDSWKTQSVSEFPDLEQLKKQMDEKQMQDSVIFIPPWNTMNRAGETMDQTFQRCLDALPGSRKLDIVDTGSEIEGRIFNNSQ